MEKKTVKYHIPQHGIYMYARTNSGKTELIVLNSTDAEQVVANDHYASIRLFSGFPITGKSSF